MRIKIYTLLKLLAVAVYLGVSKYVFEHVNDEAMIVIDELFHIPQGLAYCDRNYTHWDPKITTLPGLYLVSSAFLGNPYLACSKYNLRLLNLFASCINLLLFSSILKFVYYNESRNSKIVLQALNLTILPPLYFFSHVYYTDVMSLTFLLAFFRLCLVNRYKLLILIFGVASVLMRQTNVVWVAMVFGHKLLDIIIRSSRVFGNTYLTSVKLTKNSLIAQDVDSSKVKRYYDIKDVAISLTYHITTCFRTFFKFVTGQDLAILFTHGVLLITFVVFVYLNGSIVVGDKTAHTAAIHTPQLLYFLIFYGVFGLPYVVAKLPSTMTLILRNKFKVILLAVVMASAVHYNTIVHPYLLADNRHYTFYIWNRWYGRYVYAKYATIPLYIFLLFNLYDNLKGQNCVSFLLPYTICLCLVVALQKMIEVRYFLIPYIILRLRFVRPSMTVVVLEFVWYMIINYAAFYVFFNKEVMWNDFDYVQRIIW